MTPKLIVFLTTLILITLVGCGSDSKTSKSSEVETDLPNQVTSSLDLATTENFNTPISPDTPTDTQVPQTARETPGAPETSNPAPELSATQENLTATESSPVTTSESATTTNSSSLETKNCTDNAAFYGDVTVPDGTLFRQGDSFVKTWSIHNAGTCPWDSSYSFVFIHGNNMNGALRQSLGVAAPGETIQISIDLTAPLEGGQHIGRYLIEDDAGQRFGIDGQGPIWVMIEVNYIPPQASSTENTTESNLVVTGDEGCTHERNSQYEIDVLELINNTRQSNGLPHLTAQSQLFDSALSYSLDMACQDRVDFYQHTDTNGDRWYERIESQGYSYSSAYENVYVGNPTFGTSDGRPQGALNYWLNSEIHKKNILRSDVKEIGIAYVFTTHSTFGGYYTVVFASP